MPSTSVEAAPIEPKTKPVGKVRKRAAKACLSCRARKVRCDVSQRGRPCMNCYLDSETCVVTGRASRLWVQPNDSSVSAANGAIAGEQNAMGIMSKRLIHRIMQMTAAFRKRQKTLCGQDSMESRQPQRKAGTRTLTKRTSRMSATAIVTTTLPTTQSEKPRIYLRSQHQRATVDADITYSYYPFLNVTNLHNIMPQDVNYLESQGCLRVPTREILDEFVQQYFLHVHPMLPMINEGDFWDMYGHFGYGGSGDKMSLLVFQSMLFASCNFVSKESIKAVGFSSIRAARATLYRRCKLLYDFDSESSMVYLAQAALLLSHWSPNFTHAFKKANSTWLGIAIQNAKSAEAHHYSAMPAFSSTASPVQKKKQNVLKRLWWCCIIRDRILPLGLRRSVKITRSHFDFDANAGLGYADLADEVDRSKVYNSGTKKCLIEIFVQIVDLCAVLTDLLMLVFPLDDSPGWGKKAESEDTERVRECKHALRRWYKGATLRFPMFGGDLMPRMSVSGGKGFQHDSVIVYTNLMYMYYHSSRVALSHHEVLQTAAAAASPNLTSNLKEFSTIYDNRHELQDAASGVTECLKELIQLRLARWLPISASTSIFNAQEAVKQHHLNILIEAMKTYQPQYDGVDYISETIRHIVTLAQLDTPEPPSTSNTISDWQDILASQPGCYLRLAMTMDLSLSKASLRGLFTAGYSSIKALMGSGKTHLAPLPHQNTQNTNYFNPQDLAFVPNVSLPPGTVHSVSSDADTDSPQSVDDRNAAHGAVTHGAITLQPHQNTGEDVHMTDHSFVDAALEMEGLAGEVLAAYSLQNDSPTSSASDFDGDSTIFNEEAAMTDWIGNAWGNEEEVSNAAGVADRDDQETAKALLDALKDGDGARVECGA
ncbi:fungal-specific transcription factor [Xylariales sp. AK1849]|nr:fungal-specific transcription factor [Xylariales sp. AK1849]